MYSKKQKLLNLFPDERTPCSIVQELEKAGIPTAFKKGKWSVLTLLRILKKRNI